MTIENIIKASQSTDLALSDLQQALNTADAVEALLILSMIQDAAKLRNNINAMAAAMRATD